MGGRKRAVALLAAVEVLVGATAGVVIGTRAPHHSRSAAVRPVALASTAPTVRSPAVTPPTPAPAASATHALTRSAVSVRHAQLPALRAEPPCPNGHALPAPTSTRQVAVDADWVSQPVLVGHDVWFTREPRNDDAHRMMRVEGVDLDTGATLGPTVADHNLVLLAAGPRSAWGIDGGNLERLVQLDLAGGRVARRWSGWALTPTFPRTPGTPRPLSVTLGGDTVYVLGEVVHGVDSVAGWLSAIDATTGQVRWTVRTVTPYGWSYVDRIGVAVSGDSVYVALVDYTLPARRLKVVRYDLSGATRAVGYLTVPRLMQDPGSIVATGAGVYIAVDTPLADRSVAGDLIRLDPVSLQLSAYVPTDGVFDVQAGPTGVWTQANCAAGNLTSYDPMTLRPTAVYSEASDAEVDLIATGARPVTMSQSTAGPAPAVFSTYPTG